MKANDTILFIYFCSVCPEVPFLVVKRRQVEAPGGKFRLGQNHPQQMCHCCSSNSETADKH